MDIVGVLDTSVPLRRCIGNLESVDVVDVADPATMVLWLVISWLEYGAIGDGHEGGRPG